jgi:hypothetical protein
MSAKHGPAVTCVDLSDRGRSTLELPLFTNTILQKTTVFVLRHSMLPTIAFSGVTRVDVVERITSASSPVPRSGRNGSPRRNIASHWLFRWQPPILGCTTVGRTREKKAVTRLRLP